MKLKKTCPADFKVFCRLLDETWFCPNCSKKAEARFHYGQRILKCQKCGEFLVSVVLK